MSYTRDRDEFIAQATKAGLPLDTARLLLRYSTTLQRLACAQCNGDWPYDNGERKVIPCPECEAGCLKSAFKKGVCPDCYTSARVKVLLAESTLQSVVNGDPRGAVLVLYDKGETRENIDSGRSRGLYVPAGGR